MAELKVPIVCTVIGEGGSGGALAIAVGDTTLMLQYSTYSVISPEGCASILWKSADYAAEAAETLGITATRLKALGLVDKIVHEPLGGAHRDHEAMMQSLKKALQDSWRQLRDKPVNELLEARFEDSSAMASSRKSKRSKRVSTDLAPHVAARLKTVVEPGDSLVLGLSGGVDSMVLLDVLARLAKRAALRASGAARQSPVEPQCRALGALLPPCRERGIACRVAKVALERGNSVERAAREARYAALHKTRADFIVLAHNDDDQAETVLLQLLRGARRQRPCRDAAPSKG